jgi:SPP1 gp7 family putative phage head morphogenesis protein
LGIERQYVAARRQIERAKANLVRELLIERLPELARMAGLRADAEHFDQSPWRALLDHIMRDITSRYARAESFAREAAEDAAGQMSIFNRREINRQMRSAIGIDIFADDPDLVDALEQFVTDNVAAITTTSPQNFQTIERIVNNGFRAGQRASTVADQLVKQLGVQQSKAEFWARDQIGSLNGQLTRQRQKDIGVEEYIWRTSMDERVRETHRALEGTKHSWDDPPTVGAREVHPGEDYNCRCTAEPVIPGVTNEKTGPKDVPRDPELVAKVRKRKARARRRVGGQTEIAL